MRHVSKRRGLPDIATTLIQLALAGGDEAAALTALAPRFPVMGDASVAHAHFELALAEAASLVLGALFAIAAMPTIEDADLDPERLASVVRLLVRGIQPTLPGA